MKVSELGHRYSRAIFEIAQEKKAVEKTFSELRAIVEVLEKDPEVKAFLYNPGVPAETHLAVIKKALDNSGISAETIGFVELLAQKRRLALFEEIVFGFQDQLDAMNGVSRAFVRSATALDSAERSRIEASMEKVTKKKVITSYKVDPKVIGGLVAQVGTYTFDDSIDSHIRRMNEELKRRTL